ncbi:hypothetical protein BJY04DRAFT_54009 [Aspergillus karnatakaensis]|uniref:F-box protein n=1 Tax=Aspergillus karnatakaensis TaxID=1810916 RepID=UPI003CCE2992
MNPKRYRPCIFPSSEKLLANVESCPVLSNRAERSSNRARRNSENAHTETDPFQRLPLELCVMIAVLLSTSDFLGLRYASRAMADIFHDDHFWKSRFQSGGERAFLGYLTQSSQVGNWQQLYRASVYLQHTSDTTLMVWEVLQWIKDSIHAEQGIHDPPLDFYGRALQFYHSSTTSHSRRVERVQISSRSLVTVGVSFISRQNPSNRSKGDPSAKPRPLLTEIVALELIHEDGSSVMLGSRIQGSKEKDLAALSRDITKYYRQLHDDDTALSPYHSPGVHVLYSARTFRGFRIAYNASGIYEIGLLKQNTYYKSAQNPLRGRRGVQCCELDMALRRVDEVVGTFEGRKLVDLGIRDRGKLEPRHGRGPPFLSSA